MCDRGSFSAAGKALYLSTVSVMKHVDSLEAELGARLFDRSSKCAAPTEARRVAGTPAPVKAAFRFGGYNRGTLDARERD